MSGSLKYLDAYVTVPEAAGMAGVSPYTMGKILDDGLIPFTRPRKHRRVKRRDVLAYLGSVTESGTPELATLAHDPLRD